MRLVSGPNLLSYICATSEKLSSSYSSCQFTIFRPPYLSFGVANGLVFVAAGARFAHFSKEADSL